MKINRAEIRPYVIGCSIALLSCIVLGESLKETFIFNWTASLPRGLYRRTADKAAPYIWFCVDPDYASILRSRIPKGGCPGGIMPLIKPQVPVKSAISLTPEGAVVDGALLPNTAPKYASLDGIPLAHCPFGRYTPDPRYVWAIDTYSKDSLDGRYFCSVPRTQIITYATRFLAF